ncbi:hypothetical protein P5673_022669 [Acropora cervicornis]|uniref:Uncharacterized protein n=1 Tax=Acropora cervicornis TaxID=6130 RepID=A0AAD9UZI8_ACRCE|nr:hypothetical protein P5673_022669 [Acropora cervicornis]
MNVSKRCRSWVKGRKKGTRSSLKR